MKEDSVPARLIKNIGTETPVLFQFQEAGHQGYSALPA